MLNGVVDWLKELTIFMVICETILSFSPTAGYKRYIKPFVGLIVLLWITSFLFGAVELDWSNRVEDIFSEYEQSVSHYLENIPVVEKDSRETSVFLQSADSGEKLKGDIINIDNITISPIEIGAIE